MGLGTERLVFSQIGVQIKVCWPLAAKWQLMRISCGSRGHHNSTVFFSWLAMRNQCRTSDRLARTDHPHRDSCPLCSQHEKTINHLLLGCVFARHIWFWVWSALGSLEQMPTLGDTLVHWCSTRSCGRCPLRGLRVIITLTMWEVWKHRNDVVFDGATPSVQKGISNVAKEGRTWCAFDLLKGDFSLFRSAGYVGI